MKKITLLTGLSALALNVALFLILSHYELFNFALSSIAIVMSIALIAILDNTSPSNGFKIGLGFFFSMTLIIKLIMSIISEPFIKDNAIVIIFICISFLECIILFIPKFLKKG